MDKLSIKEFTVAKFENEPDFFFNPDFIDYRNKDIKNIRIVPILIKGNKCCSFV